MKSTIIFAICILGLAGAVIWAAHEKYYGLSLNLEIKPAEILTLAISIVIVALLQFYVASAMTDLRAEKDLLIGNIRDALAALRACREALNACHDAGKISQSGAKQLISLFRRLSNSLDHIETSIAMCRCG